MCVELPASSPAGASVLEHHAGPTRAGVYVEPSLGPKAAKRMRRDPRFNAPTTGSSYAQPLFLDGGGTRGLVFVATEQNWVYAFDASTGVLFWKNRVGTPVPLRSLPCGNIDPLGITGTPVIDLASRAILFDAMTTPDGGTTKRHLVFGLSIDDGGVRPGYPVDVAARLADVGITFDPAIQNQRGALTILDGILYVPYGGHNGDCADYRGWVVGVPLAQPSPLQAWSTTARGGGAWAPGGVASDGSAIWVATGNTFGASVWSGGEAIVRLAPGPVFSGLPADYFAPPDWQMLDAGDVDIGGSGPVLFDVPGSLPSALAIALGKNGMAYLLDRANLGGVGPGVASAQVAGNEIINAAAAYRTPTGTYVVFKGAGLACPNGPGDLTAIAIDAGSPPAIRTAWCARQRGEGSPMVTTTDGHADALVWSVGAEGDGRLHGFDGSTGTTVFAGGRPRDAMAGVKRFVTPIAAKGRIYVAGTSALYAFAPR